MKYGMIISVLCINGLFAQNSNNDKEKFKDFIAKNQSTFKEQILAEKKATDDLSEGLGMMARIVAALNQKNASDKEATKLAQKAEEKIDQILSSDAWEKAINQNTPKSEKFAAQVELLREIDRFRDEQAEKDPSKMVTYTAQKAVIHAFLSKFSSAANI